MRYSTFDEREIYSDGDVMEEDTKPTISQNPRFMESLQLEGCKVIFVPILSFKLTRRLFIAKVLKQFTSLQTTVHSLQEDIKTMASEIVYLEDKTSILSRQVQRQREEMKKMRLELITAQHGVDQYRQIMKKYNINDGSILDSLTSTNQQLQDDLSAQKKQVYSLQQELYHVTRDNEALRDNNEKLANLVEQRATAYRLSSEELSSEMHQRPANPPRYKKKSLWKRFLSVFHRKKKVKAVPPITAKETGVKAYRSASSPVEETQLDYYTNTFYQPRSQSGDHYNMKENIRLLKRGSRRSITRNSFKPIPTSLSASNVHSVTDRVYRNSADSAYKRSIDSTDMDDMSGYQSQSSYDDDGLVRL